MTTRINRSARGLLYLAVVVAIGVLVGLLVVTLEDSRQARIGAQQQASEALATAQDRVTRASVRIDGLIDDNSTLAERLGASVERQHLLEQQLRDVGVDPVTD